MGEEKRSGDQSINEAFEALGNHGYCLQERLNWERRGHAEVYRVTDVSGSEFAAKLACLQNCQDETEYLALRYQLRQEKYIGEKIIHEHILRIVDLFEGDEWIWLITEYAPGGSLLQRIQQGGPLPEKEIIRLGIDLCDALNHLHRTHTVLHRDLTPANILFADKDRVVIADFGLVQRPASSNGKTPAEHEPIGTPGYRAPEVEKAPFEHLPASDLYSLGCIFYEAATARRYCENRKDSPRKVNPDISKGLDSIILRLLKPTPSDSIDGDSNKNLRYRYAIDVQKALEQLDSGDAGLKRPPESPRNRFPVILPSAARPTFDPKGALRLSLGDGIELDMVPVPEGKFLMGSAREDRRAIHNEMIDPRERDLGAYFISRYLITRRQYQQFMRKTGLAVASIEVDDSSLPVIVVNFQHAAAFCRWATKITGRRIWLPNEAQWEKAARGEDGRRFPWGPDEPTEKLCNFNDIFHGLTPVGYFSPGGDSPYRCADMAGNAWEWTCTQASGHDAAPEDEDLTSAECLTIKGGSWVNDASFMRCAARSQIPGANLDWKHIGFRVVMLEGQP